MKYYQSLFLLVSLFATIFLFPAFANVESLCKDIAKADPKNVIFDFCVSEMEELYITENKTAPQLGALSFTITMVKYNSVYNRIFSILQEAQQLNQSTEIALKDCYHVYSGLGSDIVQGRNALKQGDFAAAKNKAGAALKAANICGKRIKSTTDTSKWISVLIKINNDFHQMAAISRGFAKLLPIVN